MFNKYYFPNFMDSSTGTGGYTSATYFGDSIETDCLYQTAAYWKTAGVDRDGEKKVNSPIDIPVRWEYVKGQIFDPQKGTISTDATVITNQEITVGSLMWLGANADFTDGSDILFEVVRYRRIPDIKNQHIRHKVFLIKYHSTLPTVV